MPKINPRIKSIDDLLGLDATEESRIESTPSVSLPVKNTIITLPPQAIRAFRGHPFRLYEGDRLNDLVESISEHGVLRKKSILSVRTATCSAWALPVPANPDAWCWKASVFWALLENPSSAPTPKPNCSTTPLIF